MSAQPEALRLADALDLYATGDKHQRSTEAAAAELRRQHALIEKMAAALMAIYDRHSSATMAQAREALAAHAKVAK